MTETILFDIDIACTGTPTLEFYIDDRLYPRSMFTATLEFGKHTLSIVHSGKTNHTPNQGAIIQGITVDGIDIETILYTDSVNTPIYPEPWATQQRSAGVVLEETVRGQLELAHNCTWQLEFTSPFYKFVMDHVR